MEFYYKEEVINIKKFFIKNKWSLVIAAGFVLFFSLFFTGLGFVINKGDTYKINNVMYTGEIHPVENFSSYVMVTFQDQNEDRFKLFINKNKIDLLEKNSHYNVTYMMNTASQPNDYILTEWSVSTAEKKTN